VGSLDDQKSHWSKKLLPSIFCCSCQIELGVGLADGDVDVDVAVVVEVEIEPEAEVVEARVVVELAEPLVDVRVLVEERVLVEVPIVDVELPPPGYPLLGRMHRLTSWPGIRR
jgi:hypothetical protein